MVTFRSAIVMHEIMPSTGYCSAIVLLNKKNTAKYIQTKARPSRPFGKQAEELDTDMEAESLKTIMRGERAIAIEENWDPDAQHISKISLGASLANVQYEIDQASSFLLHSILPASCPSRIVRPHD
jgi:hypothetical protein